MNCPDPIYDIHTHTPAPGAVVNRYPGEPFIPGMVHSIGIHPWHTRETTDRLIASLRTLAAHPATVAIGETGIDQLRGADTARQENIFRIHAELAEIHSKPLIIHSVRSHHLILSLHKQLRPASPWIIHGFRGNPTTARQLVAAGLLLSLGPRFNPDVPTLLPAEKLLLETDNSDLTVNEVSNLTGLPLRDLRPLLTP